MLAKKLSEGIEWTSFGTQDAESGRQTDWYRVRHRLNSNDELGFSADFRREIEKRHHGFVCCVIMKIEPVIHPTKVKSCTASIR